MLLSRNSICNWIWSRKEQRLLTKPQPSRVQTIQKKETPVWRRNARCDFSLQQSIVSDSKFRRRWAKVNLPNDCRQAWMSSSQLAPLVRFPRAMVDLLGAVCAGLGLWNLWGRPGGETRDLEPQPGVPRLKKKKRRQRSSEGEEGSL